MMVFWPHAKREKWDLFEVRVQMQNFTLKEGDSECIKQGKIAVCHPSSVNYIFSLFIAP